MARRVCIPRRPLPRLCRAVLPQMVARGAGGKIVVMGSASTLRGMKRASTYSAARGAQLAYVRALGVEMAPHQVQVNAIAQNFGQPHLFSAGVRPTRASRERLQRRCPWPAGGGPRDAAFCAYLASAAADCFVRAGLFHVRRLGAALRARSGGFYRRRRCYASHVHARLTRAIWKNTPGRISDVLRAPGVWHRHRRPQDHQRPTRAFRASSASPSPAIAGATGTTAATPAGPPRTRTFPPRAGLAARPVRRLT